jgi:hypothetical protein
MVVEINKIVTISTKVHLQSPSDIASHLPNIVDSPYRGAVDVSLMA